MLAIFVFAQLLFMVSGIVFFSVGAYKISQV